jgi:hypothetical protein
MILIEDRMKEFHHAVKQRMGVDKLTTNICNNGVLDTMAMCFKHNGASFVVKIPPLERETFVNEQNISATVDALQSGKISEPFNGGLCDRME